MILQRRLLIGLAAYPITYTILCIIYNIDIYVTSDENIITITNVITAIHITR